MIVVNLTNYVVQSVLGLWALCFCGGWLLFCLFVLYWYCIAVLNSKLEIKNYLLTSIKYLNFSLVLGVKAHFICFLPFFFFFNNYMTARIIISCCQSLPRELPLERERLNKNEYSTVVVTS